MTKWLLENRERVSIALGASSWAMPLAAAAQFNQDVRTPGAVSQTGFDTFENTIRNVFNIVIVVAGVAFVVLFLIGGLQYLAGMGNEETTKKARQLLLDAAIGLVIVVTAWAVGTYVLQLLGLSKSGELDISPVKQ